jgi:hypothetical protein
MQESREKIKNRMVKNASRLWGYTDTEAESTFDPVVGMIMGALAAELEKISGEIHESGSRVIEKLVQLLTPEPLTSSVPAHCVMAARPVQAQFQVYPSYQFYVYKKVRTSKESAKTEDKIIFFTPAGYYKLLNGNIRYMAAGEKMYEFSSQQTKEIICQSNTRKHLDNTELWIGLELGDEVSSFEGLSVFFDLRSELYKDTFYQSLGRTKWSLNDQPVSFTQGYAGGIERTREEIDAILNQELDVTAKVRNHVNMFYRKRFISWNSDRHQVDKYLWKNQYPAVFNEIFPQRDLERIAPNLFWFKVEFPQPFPPETFEDLFCSLNCFPAMNRHQNDFTHTSREMINIIPLNTEETFLDINKVSNSEGNTYSMKAFATVSDMEKGNYLLRQGSIGRFDTRNAVEILNYLTDLLRDESAAFSILGTDMISSSLKELNQTIARLEQRLDDYQLVKENTPYLMLKALPKDETVFVEFWSTNGSLANGIKPDNKVFIYEGSDMMPDSVNIMTKTVGGRERMNAEERINSYRKALLSRGRIVTAEDIKALCYEHFGSPLESVEVKKGIMKGLLVDSGFMRSIDIYLSFSKRAALPGPDEMEFQLEDLRVKLEERSTNIFPFRIIVQ